MKHIPLTRRKTAIVDEIDADLCKLYWYASYGCGKFYAARYIRPIPKHRAMQRMHRVILERILDRPLLKSEHVDHINGNGLDNRRENLRLATPRQNAANKRKTHKDTTSKYKGVSWHKANNKWRATIRIDSKCKHLGLFENEIDAANAYNDAAKRVFGSFCNLNRLMEAECH